MARSRSRAATAPRSRSRFRSTGPRMPDVRILVVEDEAIVAMDIANILRRLGYAVIDVVSRGESAVAIATSTRPDLVLMDIRLKGNIDGIEAARRLRDQMNVPFGCLSAHAESRTI